MKQEELNQMLQREVIVKMAEAKDKSGLVKNLRFQLSQLEGDKIVEISDLDHETARNLKDFFKPTYHVVGPSIDETNTKFLNKRYCLAFIHYQVGVQNA